MKIVGSRSTKTSGLWFSCHDCSLLDGSLVIDLILELIIMVGLHWPTNLVTVLLDNMDWQSVFNTLFRIIFCFSFVTCTYNFVFIAAHSYAYFPLYHLQGTNDDIVDWSHGKRLWELSREKYDPLWVQGGGHCNLETYPEYIKHLRKFINAMEKISLTNQSKKQLTSTSSITEVKHNKCLRFGRR